MNIYNPKVRVWDKQNKKMYYQDNHQFFSVDYRNCTVDINNGDVYLDFENQVEAVLMTYINFTDSYQEEIYDKDVVKVQLYNEVDRVVAEDIYVIEFNNCSFEFFTSDFKKGKILNELYDYYGSKSLKFEVIGNILMQPNLMEEQKYIESKDLLRCPYCNYVFKGSYGLPKADDEADCPKCSQVFSYEREVYYKTYKVN